MGEGVGGNGRHVVMREEWCCCRKEVWTNAGACTWSADSHMLSTSGYPFHLIRYWSCHLRPK